MFFRSQPRGRRSQQSRRSRPATMGIESLEQRLPLAGDVTLGFDNGTLTITGDAQGNQILVSEYRNQIMVSPSPLEMNGHTRLRVGTVVGLPHALFGRVQNIVVDLRGGNDVLTMRGSETKPLDFLALTVNLGGGNNTLTAQGINLAQSAIVRAGGGIDSIELDQVTVQGSTSIQAGNGDNRIRVSRSWLVGPVEVIGGLNNDRIDIHEISASTLRLRAGDGHDTIAIESSTVDVLLDIATGAGHDRVGIHQVQGPAAFVVNTGDGNDVVTGSDWSLGPRSLTVNLGSGQNEARFNGVTIGGPMTVTAGVGQDAIDLRNVSVEKLLTINPGHGNNRVTVTQLSALSVQITTGQGADQVSLLHGRSGEIYVQTGAGADQVAILGIEANGISVGLGAGDDVMTLQWNHFRRRPWFDGGAGRDTVRYMTTELGTRFFFGFEVLEQIMI